MLSDQGEDVLSDQGEDMLSDQGEDLVSDRSEDFVSDRSARRIAAGGTGAASGAPRPVWRIDRCEWAHYFAPNFVPLISDTVRARYVTDCSSRGAASPAFCVP
jgi:hypothetical protein